MSEPSTEPRERFKTIIDRAMYREISPKLFEILMPILQAEIDRAVAAAFTSLPLHAWPNVATYPQQWGAELRQAIDDKILYLNRALAQKEQP